MSIIKRLDELLLKNGIPKRNIKRELANTCNLSYEAIRQWYTGDSKNIRNDNLTAIAKRFNTTTDWILTGKETKTSDNRMFSSIKKQNDNIISMPILLDQSTIDNQFNVLAGIDMNIENLKKLVNFTDSNKLQPYSMPDDSMKNTFDIGDWLLIDQAITKIDKNGVYLVNYLHEQCVRRFQLSPNKDWLMIPDNSNYQTFPIKTDDLIVIGKVIYAWNGRRI